MPPVKKLIKSKSGKIGIDNGDGTVEELSSTARFLQNKSGKWGLTTDNGNTVEVLDDFDGSSVDSTYIYKPQQAPQKQQPLAQAPAPNKSVFAIDSLVPNANQGNGGQDIANYKGTLHSNGNAPKNTELAQRIDQRSADVDEAIDYTIRQKEPNIQKGTLAYKNQYNKLKQRKLDGDLGVTTTKSGKKVLVPTEGFAKSLFNTVKHSVKAPIEALTVNSIDDPKKLADYYDKKDMEQPEVPEGVSGGFGGWMGETIGGVIKPIGLMSLNAVAPSMGTGIATAEAYHTAMAAHKEALYNAGKKQLMDAGMPEEKARLEAAKKAMDVAPDEALFDAATMYALGASGSKAAAQAASPATKTFAKVLKGTLKDVSKMSALGGAAEGGKAVLEKVKGYDVSTNDVIERTVTGMRDWAAMDLALGFAMNPLKYPKALISASYEVLRKAPKEVVAEATSKMGEEGQKFAENLQKYSEQAEKVEQVVPEEHIPTYAGILLKKKNLQDEMNNILETTDPLFHDKIIEDYSQKISKIDAEIKDLQGKKDPTDYEINDQTGQKLGEFADSEESLVNLSLEELQNKRTEVEKADTTDEIKQSELSAIDKAIEQKKFAPKASGEELNQNDTSEKIVSKGNIEETKPTPQEGNDVVGKEGVDRPIVISPNIPAIEVIGGSKPYVDSLIKLGYDKAEAEAMTIEQRQHIAENKIPKAEVASSAKIMTNEKAMKRDLAKNEADRTFELDDATTQEEKDAINKKYDDKANEIKDHWGFGEKEVDIDTNDNTDTILEKAEKKGGIYAELAKALKGALGNVKTVITNAFKSDVSGNADYGDNLIRINNKTKYNKFHVFFHEALHHVTLEKIREFESNPNSKKLTSEEFNAIINLKRIFKQVSEKINQDRGGRGTQKSGTSKEGMLKGYMWVLPTETNRGNNINDRGFANVHEFISEAFSNPEFQKLLSSFKGEGNKPTIFKQFLDAVAKLLGLKDPTILDDIFHHTEKLIDEKQPTPKAEVGKEGVGDVLKPKEGKMYRVVDRADGATGDDVSFHNNMDWYEGDGFILETSNKNTKGQAIGHNKGQRGDFYEPETIYYEPEAFTDSKYVTKQIEEFKKKYPDANFVRIETTEGKNGELIRKVVANGEFENIINPKKQQAKLLTRSEAEKEVDALSLNLDKKFTNLDDLLEYRNELKDKLQTETDDKKIAKIKSQLTDLADIEHLDIKESQPTPKAEVGKEAKSESVNEAEPTNVKERKVSEGWDKDVETTAKALEDIANSGTEINIPYKGKFSDGKEFDVKLSKAQSYKDFSGTERKGFKGLANSIVPYESVAELYHADKAAGKETELTKAVEQLLGKPNKNSTNAKEQETLSVSETLDKDSKKEFLTKSGKQKVVRVGNELVVTDAKTSGKVSKQTERKAIREYVDNFDFTVGKEGESFDESLDPIRSIKDVVESTENPHQLAVLFAEHYMPFEVIDMTVEDMIANYGLGGFTLDSYRRFGDINKLTRRMRANYIAKKGDIPTTLDSWAKSISDYYYPDGDGTEISPQDLIEFMEKYESQKDYSERKSPVLNDIEEKFKQLTGIKLTTEIAQKAIDQKIQKLSEEEQKFLIQQYETEQQFIDEYWKRYEETDGFTKEAAPSKTEQGSGSNEGAKKQVNINENESKIIQQEGDGGAASSNEPIAPKESGSKASEPNKDSKGTEENGKESLTSQNQKIQKDANDIITGKKVFERFSQDEQRGFAEGGAINAEASLILSRENSTSAEASNSNEAQENSIENYAKVGKFEAKAREISDYINSLEMPSWLKIDDNDAQKMGVDYNVVKKLLGEALIEGGKALDRGVELAESALEGAKKLIEYYKSNGIKLSKEQEESIIKGVESELEKITKDDAGGGKKPPTDESEPLVYSKDPDFTLKKDNLNRVRAELGLDEFSGEVVSDLQAIKNAQDKISEWKQKGIYNKEISKIVSDASEGKFSDLSQNILAQHIADLKYDLKNNIDRNSKEYNEKLNTLKEAIQAGDLIRSEAGRALGRTLVVKPRVVESLVDVEVDMMQDYAVSELTEEQKKQAEKRFAELQKSYDELSDKQKQADEEIERLKAENELLKAKKQAASSKPKNKTTEDYKKERDEIIKSIKDKWKKAGNDGTLSSDIPFRKQLVAIAPDVAKLIKSYLEQGGNKTIEQVRKLLKADIEEAGIDVTDEEVRGLIAGRYNQKKPTKTKTVNEINQLRKEEELLLQLESLENGIEPKTESKKIARNQKLKALRDKIDEIQKKNKFGKYSDEARNETTAKARITNNKRQQEEALRRIKENDFSEPEVSEAKFDLELLKKNNPQLYKDYMQSVVDKENALFDYESKRLEDKLKNRNKLQKLADIGETILETSKGTVAMFDQSVVLVQALLFSGSHPLKATQYALKALKNFANKGAFEREMAELHMSGLWDIITKSELAIYEPRSAHKEVRSEIYGGKQSLWNKDIKVGNKNLSIGQAFERSTTTFLDQARLYLFKNAVENLMQQGKSIDTHLKEYKDAARVVNEFTGHGKVQEDLAKAMPIISKVIWSPRMFSSTFNVLGLGDLVRLPAAKKGFYGNLSPSAKKFAVKELGRFLGGAAAIMLASKLIGGDEVEVDMNPLSSDFGSIMFGNKSISLFGRYGGAVKALSQSILGLRYINGKKDVLGETNYDKNSFDVAMGAFGRGKMTPAAGMAFDLILNHRKNYYTKEDLDAGTIAKQLTMPMAAKDMVVDFQRDPVIVGILETLYKVYGGNMRDSRDFQKTSKGKSGTSRFGSAGSGSNFKSENRFK